MAERRIQVPVHPGDVIAGKFRVEKILGAGGMGVVVSAFHLELEQRVALKFLLPEAAERPDVVSRFSREARALAKIRSEHVARVMDVGTLEDGKPYIMMEHLEGRDLAYVLKKEGPLPIEVAVDFVLQACVALAESHVEGIIHRDLKPSNLFLARQSDGTEVLKLLDFGIAKMPLTASDAADEVGVLTTTTDMFGSPRYMSPEQLKSFRDVDARTDLWALGVIFYESVTGLSPFGRNSMSEIIWAVALYEPPLLHDVLPAVPEALALIIARCLQKDPVQRYANAAELSQALLPFGSSEAVTLSERAVRVMRRAGHSLGAELIGTEEPRPSSSVRGGSKTAQQGIPLAVPPAEGGTTINRAVSIYDTQRTQPSGAPRKSRWRLPVALSLVVVVVAVAGALLLLRSRAAPVLTDTTKQASSAAALSVAQVAPPPIEPVAPPSVSVRMMPSAAPATVAASASAAPRKSNPPGRQGQPGAPVKRSPGADQHEFGDRR